MFLTIFFLFRTVFLFRQKWPWFSCLPILKAENTGLFHYTQQFWWFCLQRSVIDSWHGANLPWQFLGFLSFKIKYLKLQYSLRFSPFFVSGKILSVTYDLITVFKVSLSNIKLNFRIQGTRRKLFIAIILEFLISPHYSIIKTDMRVCSLEY